VLVFPPSQAQVHPEQHHSTMEESFLAFPLVEAQAHLKQYHFTIA
jgi:hypothetical protein